MIARMVLAAGSVMMAGACLATRGGVAPTGDVPAAGAEALALVAQARERMESGRLTEGLQLFQRAAELDPKSGELAEEYGIALAAAGLEEQAVEQLQRATALSPAGEGILGILLAQRSEEPAGQEAAVRHLEASLAANPDNDAARFHLVQTLLRLRRGEAAAAALAPLLSARPNDPRLQLMAGRAARQAGRLPEAEAYLRQAAERPPTQVEGTLELVETLAAAAKYQEAATVLGEFLQTHGATLEGLIRYATLLLRAGDQAKARKVLDDVLSRDENSAEALMLRAFIAMGDNELELAERLYRKVLALEPNNFTAAIELARVVRLLGRAEEARTMLMAVLARVEGGDPAQALFVSEAVRELAVLDLLAKKPEAARVWLDRLREGPVTRATLLLWAEYFRLRAAYREGLEWLGSLPADESDRFELERRALEGEFLLALGEEARASEVLAPLLAGDREMVRRAISVFQRVRRHREAVACARQALERFPDDVEIRFALGAALERSGEWEAAVEAFRGVIAAEPDNALALNYLGYMFAERGVNLEEARTLLERAVALDPTSGAFQDSLGWVYFRLGDLARAEKHLTRAAALEPYDPTVCEHLADLYRATGDAGRAAATYRRALELEPEEEGQRERILAKLAELTGDSAP